MGAGLTSIGSHGFFQIDEENPSLVFVSKGVTVAYSMLDAIFSTAVFTCNSFPAVFIRPVGPIWTGVAPNMVKHWDAVGEIMSISKTYGVPNSYTLTCIGGPFEYFVFGYPQTTDRFGLEIYNANRTKIFHSNAKPLKIAAVVPDVVAVILEGYGPIYSGLPTGKYAFCKSFFRTNYYSSGATARQVVFAYNITENGINQSIHGYTCYPLAETYQFMPPYGHIMLADVAGL